VKKEAATVDMGVKGSAAAVTQARVRTGALVPECVATFIIVGLGDSAAAMYTLYDPSPYQHAYWGVCIAFPTRER
jgi:glycerol uptake facilitator-like aquaporin